MTDQEINEVVAQKLNSQTTCHCDPLDSHIGHNLHYSTDIKAAWEIVEFVSQKHVVHVLTGFRGKPWNCTSWSCDIADYPGNKDHWVISESAVTAPMAICLAFLKLQ